jgi:hypothetical protein
MIEDTHMADSLIEKRKQIVREIKDLQEQIEERRSVMIGLDTTIRFLRPDAKFEDYEPGRRLPTRHGYFERGEVSRRCRDALREARGEAIKVNTIIDKAIKDKKLDPTDKKMRHQFYHTFSMSLYDMERRGLGVERVGRRRDVGWRAKAD